MAEVNNALPAGKLLKSSRNTYRVMKVLGSGGFGITYLVQAQVQENGDIVTYYFAMKEHFIQRVCERSAENSSILFSNPVRDEVENSMKDFIAEAARLQQVGVRHDNIVKVVDIFQANNTAYYVMDYLHGKSLRDYVTERGPLSPAEAKAIMTPIIDAIGFLHANNMTHLDIKPDNIMIVTGADGNPQPVLIDFGLSKHYDESGTPTSTINTLACSDGYSPVEQYGGITTFSPTADIYALGATMLFSLTGKNPKKSTEMSPRDLGTVLANIQDPTLANLIGAMMQQDRFSRPGSVKDILAVLSTPVQPAAAPTQPMNGGAVPPVPPVPPRPQPGVTPRPPVQPIKSQKSAKLPLIIGLCVGIPVLLGIIGLVLYFIFSGGNEIKEYDRGYAVERYVNLDVDGRDAESFDGLEDIDVPLGVALKWDADTDLDLLVNTPAGNDVYFGNTTDEATGGQYSDDVLSGPNAVEGIDFYSPRRGKYDIFVKMNSTDIPEEGIPAKIFVWNNQHWTVYNFSLKRNDEDVNYYYITSVNIDSDIEASSSTSTGSEPSQSDWGYVETSTTSYSSGDNITSFRQAHPWNGQDQTAQRRASSLSGSGPIKVSLLWDGNNDLDLYVNSATGEDIYYGNRSGNGGASHTGDNMGSGNNNYESISFSNPTTGIYDVFVRCRGSVSYGGLPVKVVIKNGNSVSTYRVKLPEGDGQDYRIAQFNYSGNGSSDSSSSSSNSDAPLTLASSSNTGNITYSDVITDFVRCNVSESHNGTLEQRARNLSGSGRLRITAFWDFSSDVDLIVSTPDGDDVYYSRSTDSTTGANFSGDQMGGSGSYESIYFTRPARGYYDIFVRCRGTVPSAGGLITVVVNDGSINKTYSTRIKMGSSSLKDFKVAAYNY